MIMHKYLRAQQNNMRLLFLFLILIELIIGPLVAKAESVVNVGNKLGVIAKPQLFAVYINTPDSSFKASMDRFYAALVNDPLYLSGLREYSTSPAQPIGAGTFGGSFILPVSGGAFDPMGLGSFLDRAIHTGKLPAPSANTIYMVHMNWPIVSGASIFGIPVGSPPGDQWCAMHVTYQSETTGRRIVYAILPNMANVPGCTFFGTRLDRETFNATHELVEAITDQGSAIFSEGLASFSISQSWNWVDTTRSSFINPWEIADICESSSARSTALAIGFSGTHQIANWWSNTDNRCRAPTSIPWAAVLDAALGMI